MKYTIKGITERTITFNSLGITIRGDSKNTAKYPHSIARGIDIDTVDQWNEINAIGKAGFVVIEPEEVIPPAKKPKAVKSKSKKPVKAVAKVAAKAPAKAVKRTVQADEEPSSEVTFMSADGVAAKGMMIKHSDMDLLENDSTRASLEAAKQMDDEAKASAEADAKPFDDSNLDISERMGNDVVVAGGDKKNSKQKISRSAVPTVKTDWINLEENIKDDAAEAFVDNKEPEPEKDDRFIE